MIHRRLASVIVIFLSIAGIVNVRYAGGQTTQPTVAPAAQKVLSEVRDAYAKLTSLSLAGRISIEFDAAGKTDKKQIDFSSAFQSPTRLRHEAKDEVVIVGTGEKLITYLPAKNQYFSNDVAKERSSQWPDPARGLLQEQDPSLYLTLIPDAAKELADGTSAIDKGDDVSLDGASYQAIRLVQADRDIRVLIDPQTHLVRQMQMDLTKLLKQQEVPLINKALVTIDYTSCAPGATVDATKFAWVPPAGASEIKPQKADREMEFLTDRPDSQDENPADKLVGQPAPAFVLEDLEGKRVSLADLKGSVVVLDFWATWCPPCREGLPHLDELHKAKQAEGVKVFAINLREDRAKARQFLEKQQLSLPVLLDHSGEVAKNYFVNGIPQTVVIGKDGLVKRVTVGYTEGSEKTIADAVDDAMKGQ